MFRGHPEPGGHLQWDEIDVATLCAHAPNPNTEKKNCEELLRIFNLLARETGLDFGSVDDALHAHSCQHLLTFYHLQMDFKSPIKLQVHRSRTRRFHPPPSN